jgi:hypothetical protein
VTFSATLNSHRTRLARLRGLTQAQEKRDEHDDGERAGSPDNP